MQRKASRSSVLGAVSLTENSASRDGQLLTAHGDIDQESALCRRGIL